jgi:fatty acid desaturase
MDEPANNCFSQSLELGKLKDSPSAYRRDFAPNTRLLFIALTAAVIGALSAGVAFVLLHLIQGFTNVFFFHALSDKVNSPAANLRPDHWINGSVWIGANPRARNT